MGQLSIYGLFAAEPDPLTEAVAVADPALEPGQQPSAEPEEAPADLAASRFNIAPTSTVPVVLERRSKDSDQSEVHRLVRGMHWGLVPSWAKDIKIGNRMFNARSDTLASKSAFRTPLERRRCLLPASGYFEWRKVPGPKGKPDKQPFYITPADGSVMAFAGLWEFWRSPDGEPLVSTTIITTDAVGPLTGIHDRMPLILPAADWDAWLSLDNDAAAVAPLLEPPSLELVSQLELRPVSSRVGNVRNDDAALLDPVPVDREPEPLFS
jgi:putative SOS response-associated peptidase YedK